MLEETYTSAREFYLAKRSAHNDDSFVACGKSDSGIFWLITQTIDINVYIRL